MIEVYGPFSCHGGPFQDAKKDKYQGGGFLVPLSIPSSSLFRKALQAVV
jgi:hypothetical protein